MLLNHETRYIKSNIKTVCSLNIGEQKYKAWATEMKIFLTTLRHSECSFLKDPTETFPRKDYDGHSYEWEYQVS